jgi:DNA mismatch endonuclease (patch repair protein)
MAQGFKFITTPERSRLMKKIRLKNTQPEIILRKELTKLGLRYRLHSAKLPGKPDLVLNKFKLVIFIDGEFWHGFEWKKKKPTIKSNRDYWIPKIERTIRRDKDNTKKLNELGFVVFRFWEQQIKKDLQSCVTKIKDFCQ